MIAAAYPFLASVSALADPPSEPVNVLYSILLDKNELVHLSVYNPNDVSVCTSFMNWLGPNDNLRVVGSDGKQWTYIGLIVDPVGRPEDVEIAPHTEQSVSLDLRANYKSPSAETRINKVYYGAVFHECQADGQR